MPVEAMADGYKITVAAATDALMASRGNLTNAAARLHVTRRGLDAFITAHPELAEVRRDARESALDTVEDRLWEAAEHGDSWAVTFALKTQGKHRGYSERHEHTGADGGALDMTHALKGMENLSTEEAVQLYQKIMAGGGGKR
jgi:hypothetical protein